MVRGTRHEFDVNLPCKTRAAFKYLHLENSISESHGACSLVVGLCT